MAISVCIIGLVSRLQCQFVVYAFDCTLVSLSNTFSKSVIIELMLNLFVELTLGPRVLCLVASFDLFETAIPRSICKCRSLLFEGGSQKIKDTYHRDLVYVMHVYE